MTNRDEHLFTKQIWMNDSLGKCQNILELYSMETHVVNEEFVEELLGDLESQEDKKSLISFFGPTFIEEHYPGMTYTSTNRRNESNLVKMIEDSLRKRIKKYKEEARKSRSKSLHFLDSKISQFFLEDLEKKIFTSGEEGQEIICASIKDLLSTGYEAQKMLANETRKKIVLLPQEIRLNFFEMFDLHSRTTFRRKNIELYSHYSDFYKALQVNMDKEGISSVLDWKDGRREIDEEVILTYEKNKLKHIHITDERLYHYVKVLIILKLTNGDFSTAHVYWLIKGCNYFPKPYTSEPLAAFYFHRLLDYVVFGREMIFRIAEEVETLLIKYDRSYFKHIKYSLRTIPMHHLDPDVFPKEVILKDEKDCKNFWLKYQENGYRLVNALEAKIFTDLKLYFRKWLSEGFVGCCSETGSSLIWDILFANEFRKDTIINVCYTLIYLLKHFIIDANIKDRRIHDILIEGPRVLYTSDLRKILRHLEGNKHNYDKIPGLKTIPVLRIIPPSPIKKK